MNRPGLLPRTLDRATVRMITIKRFFTGLVSLVLGVAVIVIMLQRRAQLTDETRMLAGVAVLLFFGGGGWSLYDANRVWRSLRRRP